MYNNIHDFVLAEHTMKYMYKNWYNICGHLCVLKVCVVHVLYT